jgi:hypothetical protein
MTCSPVPQRAEDAARANLRDYEQTAATFSWSDACALLDGLPGGGPDERVIPIR